MYINELWIYPIILTLFLFILNYIYFHKKLNEANDLWKIKNYKLLRIRLISIIVLIFALMIDASVYWFIASTSISNSEKEIPSSIINIFNYSQYATIILKNIVAFVLFKKIVENITSIESDEKAFSKYITYTILWISVATLPIIIWVSYMFEKIAKL